VLTLETPLLIGHSRISIHGDHARRTLKHTLAALDAALLIDAKLKHGGPPLAFRIFSLLPWTRLGTSYCIRTAKKIARQGLLSLFCFSSLTEGGDMSESHDSGPLITAAIITDMLVGVFD
jgi:hypothetical protein